MRMFLIAADLALGILLATVTIALYISNAIFTQNYISNASASGARFLYLYKVSQEIVATTQNANFSEVAEIINSENAIGGLNVTINSYDAKVPVGCGMIYLCRIVIIKGNAYLMVVK